MFDAEATNSTSLNGQEVEHAPRPAAFAVGQVLLGRYAIESLLARGGMGEVYEARHIQLGKRVAIKTLIRDQASDAAKRRFEREARVLAALENEHIVSAFDFGSDDDGRLLLVMEFLAGMNLRELLRSETSLVTPRAVRLVLQVCAGLAAAHAAGAVHRDLKPENIFICRKQDGAELCKILDFGLVKLNDQPANMVTRTGLALGTLRYMSPEQARGDKTVDHRSDVYSLAAILYEMLSGARPHEADGEFALMEKIVREQPRPLHERCAVPLELSALVQRALSTDPAARFGSIDALSRALRPFAAANYRAEPSSEQTVSLSDLVPSRHFGKYLPFFLALALLGAGLVAWANRSPAQAPRSAPVSARTAEPRVSLPPPPSAELAAAAEVVSAPPPATRLKPSRPQREAKSAGPKPVESATKADDLSFERRNPYATD